MPRPASLCRCRFWLLDSRLAEHPDHPLASENLTFCWVLFDALRSAADRVVAERQQQDLGLQHASADLRAALVCKRPPPVRIVYEALSPSEAAALAAAVAGAAQPAHRVAALLLQHWARPEQVAANRLAVAQAAASRSCADLRCTNVELEGRPGAGKGRGCKRCSGCRAVYYCGTACSRADWRAGHRLVCAQLGAARQAAAA
ncbi:hypothetical protein ABPG77_011094 [Micractinium sp. CCAP 211/92]